MLDDVVLSLRRVRSYVRDVRYVLVRSTGINCSHRLYNKRLLANILYTINYNIGCSAITSKTIIYKNITTRYLYLIFYNEINAIAVYYL